MVKRILCSLLFAATLGANELEVDKRTMQIDDTVSITITVEGSFVTTDPRITLQNLVIEGAPSVSSEFQWINGETSRRKVFRYVAHARAPGAAIVGPVTLRNPSGAVETLAPVTMQVLAAAGAGSNDPLRILRELLATSRDPIFVVAQADKTNVFENEEVVVTWTLYNATTVQQYTFGDIPKLEDFWTEELDVRAERPEDVVLGNIAMQKLVVRRVALFPLRSGTLTVPSMALNASIMKRASAGDPFGLFEGVVAEVRRRSSPLTVIARPIPPGPAVAAVGTTNLQCQPPIQRNGGPVTMDVSLSGRANLRAAQPPAFRSSVDGTTQIVDRGLSAFAVNDDRWMTRRWRYLIFPAHGGRFMVPALSATTLTPEGERREVRCDATSLMLAAAEAPGSQPPATPRQARAAPPLMAIGAIVAVAAIALLSLPRMRNRHRLRNDVRALVRATPAETRAAVEAALVARGVDPTTLVREASDRGDAFRAFRSLVDAADRDRIQATPREIGHRIRDVLIAT